MGTHYLVLRCSIDSHLGKLMIDEYTEKYIWMERLVFIYETSKLSLQTDIPLRFYAWMGHLMIS